MSQLLYMMSNVIIFFFQTLVTYKAQLEDDPIVSTHLKTLYDNLLEQNLCRIIEPFSKVQVNSSCSHDYRNAKNDMRKRCSNFPCRDIILLAMDDAVQLVKSK